MENTTYKHESGLIFETGRLMSNDEKESYDITIVMLWMPNNAATPMLLVDWYYGERNEACNKYVADKFCRAKTAEEIKELLELQDMQ